MLAQGQVDEQHTSPSEEVINMKEESRYVAMMNQLKQKIGKAKKSKLDAGVAEKEAQIAVQEAQAQGLV